VRALLVAALVGVVHVHHEPSHDSDAPFEEVLGGAFEAELDFVVLTDHVEADADGPLPASARAGLHQAPDGRRVLVLVGAEFGTADGHLVGLAIPRAYASRGRSGREVIGRIHADGGFAVVSHPFTHGGWRDFEAPFDGLEVHNNASSLRRMLGLSAPFRLAQLAFDRDAVWAAMLERPARELELFDSLLAAGRRVVAFSGADAHRNQSLLGWRLDPYVEMFRAVQTVCPDRELEADAVWRLLREGRCAIRYRVFEARAGEAREVRFPSGRTEWQLDGGRLRRLESGVVVGVLRDLLHVLRVRELALPVDHEHGARIEPELLHVHPVGVAEGHVPVIGERGDPGGAGRAAPAGLREGQVRAHGHDLDVGELAGFLVEPLGLQVADRRVERRHHGDDAHLAVGADARLAQRLVEQLHVGSRVPGSQLGSDQGERVAPHGHGLRSLLGHASSSWARGPDYRRYDRSR
jgi:hypothetical protein